MILFKDNHSYKGGIREQTRFAHTRYCQQQPIPTKTHTQEPHKLVIIVTGPLWQGTLNNQQTSSTATPSDDVWLLGGPNDAANETIWKSTMQAMHYSDVIMGAMVFQITGMTIAYSTVCSGVDKRRHQSSASLAFVRGIHRWPVNSPHKRPVTRKMFPFDDVIMESIYLPIPSVQWRPFKIYHHQKL